MTIKGYFATTGNTGGMSEDGYFDTDDDLDALVKRSASFSVAHGARSVTIYRGFETVSAEVPAKIEPIIYKE